MLHAVCTSLYVKDYSFNKIGCIFSAIVRGITALDNKPVFVKDENALIALNLSFVLSLCLLKLRAA